MKNNLIYLEHILHSIDRLNKYAPSQDKLFGNDMAYDACLRVLQTMSESVNRLSDDIKLRNNQIEWHKIRGFRNILVHDYLGEIDDIMVWKIIEAELPNLKVHIQEELKKIKNKGE